MHCKNVVHNKVTPAFVGVTFVVIGKTMKDIPSDINVLNSSS